MELIDLYGEYHSNNEKFWRGKLPTQVVVEWSEKQPFIDGVAFTYVHGMHHGIWPKGCGKKPTIHTIRIHPKLQSMDCFSGMALLHEMVHLEAVLGDQYLLYHGAHFHRRMEKLAKQKAFDPWW